MSEHAAASTSTGTSFTPQAALRFVVLLGVVSLLADMTYEGARSITGPFLAALGASGAAVGLVAGLGELVGYALRLVSGYAADRSRRYWAITILGYVVNLAAVPLLALAGRWEAAAVLMIAERVGKAIRTPARDAMLSHATHAVGHGWGFGLHEALDQVGAVLGPLSVAAVLLGGGGYRLGFGILVAPAVLALAVLTAAWRLYPHPHHLEVATFEAAGSRAFPGIFWLYLAAAAAIAAGYADFPLIAYHLGKRSIIVPGTIPVFYAFAMGVDALAALIFGRLFDRHGLSILLVSTLLSAMFAPCAFLGGSVLALLGVALWGIGMGAQESVLRAAIAVMIPAQRRGSAYGLFNAAYGLAWFLGSAVMGFLYDVSLVGLVAFSVLAQLAAIGLLLMVGRRAAP
jgi:MFS family permease